MTRFFQIYFVRYQLDGTLDNDNIMAYFCQSFLNIDPSQLSEVNSFLPAFKVALDFFGIRLYLLFCRKVIFDLKCGIQSILKYLQ